jgi:hypothetical protein
MLKQDLRRWSACGAMIVFTLLLVAGCGNKTGGRVPVSGIVEVDGKPLKGGIIYLSPDESKGNAERIGCSAQINNGRFEIQTTGVDSAATGSGAPPGWYKVSFRVDMMAGKSKSEKSDSAINPIYLDRKNTPLSIEVVENPKAGAYDLKLSAAE